MYNWSTHQLTEYFAAVCESLDEVTALATAVERATEMVEAELGCAVIDNEVRGRCGFGTEIPAEAVLAVAYGSGTLTVSGLGELRTVSSRLEADNPGMLVIARLGDDFAPEERHMLQGMAQVLGLALRRIRALSAERALRQDLEQESAKRLVLLVSAQTRQRLLETLLGIQQAISNRVPLSQILDAATAGAAALIDHAVVVLVLAEPSQCNRLVVTSASSDGEFTESDLPCIATREAMAAGTVQVRTFEPEQVHAGTVIAVPVHVSGEMEGSLVAHVPGNGDRTEERDQLVAFAQHVSLALADARTVEAVRKAHHDPVTGLPNRALFLQILKALLARAGSSGNPATVLFIDLDRFKAVNDTLGHEAGDHLLAAAAGRIQSCVRIADTAARIGGDEFAVLLHDSPPQAAVAIAERMIELIKRPFQLSGRNAFIGASVGVAHARVASTDADELLKNADVAMYRAKNEGRGKVVVFESSMQTDALSRLTLGEDLKKALNESEFHLQYQPIVRIETGEITAVEALIRWQSPIRGLVLPMNFVPIAEETGIIVDIGKWVLETATKQVAGWRHTVAPDLRLNVDVSGLQLVGQEFVHDVKRALAAARLPPHAVTLQLTESMLMADTIATVPALNDLKAVGVQLAIDHFGIGQSSLWCLHELSVDELKIDRTFIARKDLSDQSLAVFRAMIDLGNLLGLRVVAEGIESHDQLDALRQIRCPLGQGHHVCRPIHPTDLPEILAGRRLDPKPRAPK